MKNKKWIILLIAILVAVAGIVHTIMRFVTILNNQYTSFPATVALLILIPYLVCSGLCLIIWVVMKRKARCNE